MNRFRDLRPSRWDALVAAAILLLAALTAAGYWAGALRAAGGGLTAVVSAEGETLDTIDLTALREPETRTYTHNGYTLTVSFSPDGAAVAASDCPNQDCVHTGAIRSAGQSIVCLPARVSIQLTGGKPSGGVDAVIG